jgi:Spy/CpxP family protein refolding chaperone
MNRALKWKLIAGFVLVFIAGGMTGAFIVASQTHRLFFGAYHGAIADRMRHRLRLQLRLTDEQMAKISPIIDKTATQLEKIRIETGRRVHETFAEAHREMAADLTPEQRAKLQAIEERHRRGFHHMHGRRGSPSPEQSPPAE